MDVARENSWIETIDQMVTLPHLEAFERDGMRHGCITPRIAEAFDRNRKRLQNEPLDPWMGSAPAPVRTDPEHLTFSAPTLRDYVVRRDAAGLLAFVDMALADHERRRT